MYQRAITLLVEAIIVLGALIQAVLGAYLLITHGLADLSPAWPGVFTRAAHLLLWPFAWLARQSPGEVGAGIVILAMLCFLGLTIAGIGAINMLVRQPPPPSGGAGR